MGGVAIPECSVCRAAVGGQTLQDILGKLNDSCPCEYTVDLVPVSEIPPADVPTFFDTKGEVMTDIQTALYILEHNPIPEAYVLMYAGVVPFHKGGHGYSQEVWKEAWEACKQIMIVGGYGNSADANIIYSGTKEGYTLPCLQ